jgi:dihydroxyacetone kinase-like protein
MLEPALCAAWLYYGEGMKQDDIAARLGISRASVFNLLQKARQEGIVSITIDMRRMGLFTLADKLCEHTGIDECFIVPTEGAEEPLTERIALLGARVLEQRLTNDSVLGIAWGRTVMALSRALTPMRLRGASVVQLTGGSIATFDFSPELCTSNIAVKVGGRCVNLHAPGLVSNPTIKTLLLREPALQQHFELMRSCTMCLFGVTHVKGKSHLQASGFMSDQVIQEYVELGAVGFAAGIFFDREGRPVVTEADSRNIAMPREDFLKVPMRICVGGGPEKVDAIRGMLKGDYANVLITDEDTARKVLDL